MRTLTVTTERDLDHVVRRLLPSRLPKARREQALSALRAANPGVDPDRLTPGTVVVVPALEGLKADLAGIGPSPLQDLLAAVWAQAATVPTEADEALTAAAQQRDAARAVVDDPAVQWGLDRSDVVREAVHQLVDTVDRELQESEAALERLKPALGAWRQHLDALAALE